MEIRLSGGDPCHIFEEYKEYTYFSDYAAYQHIISTQVEDVTIMRLLAESRLGLIWIDQSFSLTAISIRLVVWKLVTKFPNSTQPDLGSSVVQPCFMWHRYYPILPRIDEMRRFGSVVRGWCLRDRAGHDHGMSYRYGTLPTVK